jgi:hypothetical protein
VNHAIGLITIRLSKLEQLLEESAAASTSRAGAGVGAEEEEQIQLLKTTIQGLENRLKALELVPPPDVNTDVVPRIEAIEARTKTWETHLGAQSANLGKHSIDVLKLTRDLTETKDLLKTFMMKYDYFTNDIHTRVAEIEQAAFAPVGEEPGESGESGGEEPGEESSAASGQQEGEASSASI